MISLIFIWIFGERKRFQRLVWTVKPSISVCIFSMRIKSFVRESSGSKWVKRCCWLHKEVEQATTIWSHMVQYALNKVSAAAVAFSDYHCKLKGSMFHFHDQIDQTYLANLKFLSLICFHAQFYRQAWIYLFFHLHRKLARGMHEENIKIIWKAPKLSNSS